METIESKVKERELLRERIWKLRDGLEAKEKELLEAKNDLKLLDFQLNNYDKNRNNENK